MVNKGIVRRDRLNRGVLMGLKQKSRVVQKPRNIRKSSSAYLAAQPSSSQFRVTSIKMFNFYFCITSNWDCKTGWNTMREILTKNDVGN